MTPTGPRITGAGARTPLGLNRLQVTMCARAAALEPLPCRYPDSYGTSIGVVRAASLSDDLLGVERWLALAAPALRECVSPTTGAPPSATRPPPLFLSIPQAGRADDDARVGEELLPALASRSGVALDVSRSQLVRQGHAGFATALLAGVAQLAAGSPAVLVGGVDSYYHPGVLAALDADRRVHSGAIEAGIIPAEGAAFVRLAREAGGARILGTILGVEIGRDESVVTGDPNLAEAMTKLVRRISVAAPDGRVPWILSDGNGERHRRDEWVKVAIRSKDIFPQDGRHDHPVEEMGELGAASGAVFLAVVATAWETGFAPADLALLALHSEGPERGLVLAQR
jgi:3-oxoacyl-[acyl-carrier-protein] synthase-1